MWPFSNKKKKLEELYHRISYTEKVSQNFQQQFAEQCFIDDESDEKVDLSELCGQLLHILDAVKKDISKTNLLDQTQKKYLINHFTLNKADIYAGFQSHEALDLFNTSLKQMLDNYSTFISSKPLFELLEVCDLPFKILHDSAFFMSTTANVLEEREYQMQAYLYCVDALIIEELGPEKWNKFMDYGSQILVSASVFLDISQEEKRNFLLEVSDKIHKHFSEIILSDQTLEEAISKAGYRPARLYDHMFRIYYTCGNQELAQKIEVAVCNAPLDKDWREMYDWRSEDIFEMFVSELDELGEYSKIQKTE